MTQEDAQDTFRKPTDPASSNLSILLSDMEQLLLQQLKQHIEAAADAPQALPWFLWSPPNKDSAACTMSYAALRVPWIFTSHKQGQEFLVIPWKALRALLNL
eukprot:TRINITY_DN62499_c0_g1_i1.p1 TRINITY_DN62499_c0_g1~~TRINITY_DN62499_c0_g1_i1.p1  ORF type:complete len:102 (+),score=19.43 TRINITY_DN62499_c0_g1_i1:3-308(+)